MLKLYNDNNEFVGNLLDYRGLNIVETLEDGIKTLYFQLPCREPFNSMVKPEYYIETADYSYVIKEINYDNNEFFEVYCGANTEVLSGKVYRVFDGFQMGLKQLFQYCLNQSGWSLNYQSQDNSIATYQESNTNALEMIRTIAEDYGLDIWLDTKKKVLNVYDEMGKALGAYYSNEIKLKQLVSQSTTYDFATVLYPYGKDGLTIKIVNNNKEYIENFTYSNKRIEAIYENEDITVPEKLLAEAQDKLNEMAQPRSSYEITLSSLDKSVSLGDKIIILDKLKHIKQKQRVVQISRHPQNPEEDTIQISNLQVNLVNSLLKSQKDTQKEIKRLKKLYEELK